MKEELSNVMQEVAASIEDMNSNFQAKIDPSIQRFLEKASEDAKFNITVGIDTCDELLYACMARLD